MKTSAPTTGHDGSFKFLTTKTREECWKRKRIFLYCLSTCSRSRSSEMMLSKEAFAGSAANSLKQRLSSIHKTMSIALAPRQVLLLVVLVFNMFLKMLILLVPLLAVAVLLLVAAVPLLVAAVPLLVAAVNLRCVIILFLIPLETLLVWKRSSMTLITMGTEKHGGCV
jgi:hypothetical protein